MSTPTGKIALQEITAANRAAVLALTVAEEQRPFVAPNTTSLAQAAIHQEAWVRAIYADDVPVGFLMLHDENLRDVVRQDDYYFLWRFMIDARFQGRGFGRRALQLLIAHVRQRPHATVLLTSVHAGPGTPEAFYTRLGFTRTGTIQNGEVELRLRL